MNDETTLVATGVLTSVVALAVPPAVHRARRHWTRAGSDPAASRSEDRLGVART